MILFLENEAKPFVMDRRFSRGGVNFCRGPSNDETGTDFNSMETTMEIDEDVFEKAVDEKTVEITKF